MRDGFHHPARGPGWKLRVGVERDDVANRRGQAAFDQNLVRAFAAQERVQFFDLAALPLAADPHPLAFGPYTLAVEQQEMRARIALVETGDALAGGGEQVLIALDLGFGRVRKIGEKAEKKIRFRGWRESALPAFRFAARTTLRLDSIIGTVTSVAFSAGMPSLKSILGSGSGGSSEMTSALTI